MRRTGGEEEEKKNKQEKVKMADGEQEEGKQVE